LYAEPRHPYTLGLLGSIPRLDEDRRRKLTPIDGLPPDLIGVGDSCPFAPRCRFQKEYNVERCLRENPILETVGLGHQAACWFDVRKGTVR
jgi:oligopeptide transport system ATP-binding protein